MTGFMRGFFAKPKYVDETSAAPEEVVSAEEKGAFFLDATDAQTMGNAEYMKASKKIRRTFPKTLDTPEHMEYVQELSAMERVANGKAGSETAPKVDSKPSENKSFENSALRRSTGSDMDMFRNMAKDIRK
jgi:hypothetical protein